MTWINKSYFNFDLHSQIMETTTSLGNQFPTPLLSPWEQFIAKAESPLLHYFSWLYSNQKFSLLFAISFSHNLAMFLFCLKILFLDISLCSLPLLQWCDATVQAMIGLPCSAPSVLPSFMSNRNGMSIILVINWNIGRI